MRNSDKLIELTEQATLTVNTLSPTDLSEIGNLQEILGQISESIAEIEDAPAGLLEQTKGQTSSSVEMIGKILQQDIEGTSQAIEIVSQTVTKLQSLIAQVTQNAVSSDSGQTKEIRQEEDKSVGQEGTTILDEDLPLVLDFIAESDEHIESAEAGLLDLESKSDDSEVLNQIFRAFHTIKGMAGFLNLSEIGSLAHSAENLLDGARKGELVLSGANSDAVFESIDMLKKMILILKESAESGKPIPAHKGLSNLLAKLKDAVESKDSGEFIATPEGQKKDEVLDEVLCTEGKVEIREVPTKARSSSGDEKIKVSTARLDNLINMAGELVIAQLMVTEEISNALSIEPNLSRKIAHQSKIVRELQELSMSMRMVPIHGVFQKMARLVRDLSHKAGKDVSFSTVGDDTELDRNIVDKIADPLVHMVRNSVDHGIEPQTERIKTGKSPNGQLELRAFHQAGDIVIEIEDDGRGLDKERILEKAVKNGIIEPGQELSDQEIYKLIFHAGLSTAQQVTSISGRGVGMDVVKKNIESLHGKIEIDSKFGVGTTFTVRLPLTLAIIDGQIVRVGGESYIIPINSIVRSLKPTREQISSVQGRGEMVMVRGKLLPLIRLYELFNVTSTTTDPTKTLLVVVEEDNNKCCLLVDELLGQQQLVIKNLGEALGSVKGVSGGAIMGDGRVRLILDVPSLMKLAYN